jgi:hypothetical protein
MRSMTPKALVCGAALIALFAGCGEEDTAQATRPATETRMWSSSRPAAQAGA